MGRFRLTLSVAVAGAALVAATATAAPVADRGTATDTGERGTSFSIADAPERVVFISDSALAYIRWSNNLYRLTNAAWDARLESCRRLWVPSCRGREGYAPETTAREIQLVAAARGPAHPDEVLVIATGYNDWHAGFQSSFDAVMHEARRAGFRHVAWLTYHSTTTYTAPGNGGQGANYALMNQILRDNAASGNWPELTIFEYDAAVRANPWWVRSDGVHLTTAGAAAVADWLSSQIRYAYHPEFAPENWIPYGDR